MIIHCENCEANFKLDDSLIPERGRKVKCSKCQHVFRVQRPSAPPPSEESESLDTRLEEEVETLASNEIQVETLAPEEEEISPPPPEETEVIEPTVKIDLAEQEELSFEEEEPNAEPAPSRSSILRPFLAVAALGLILGLLLWLGWTQRDRLPLLSRFSESPTDNLIIDRAQLVGKFEKKGQIFIMMGTVRNQSKQPRSYIKVRGLLLDQDGRIVEETWAYCGNPIPIQDLKTKGPAEIQNQMRNRDGLREMNKLIAPNGSIPFTVVFFERPEGVQSFGAEIAEAVIPESS